MADSLTDLQFVIVFLVLTAAVAWCGRQGFCAARRAVRRYRVARFLAEEARRPDAVPDPRTLRCARPRPPIALASVSGMSPKDAWLEAERRLDSTSLADDLASRLIH